MDWGVFMKKYLLATLILTSMFLISSAQATWWNEDWHRCRDVRLYQENILARTKEAVKVMISDIDITECDQLRFVNAPCNEGGNEIPSQILDDSDEANGNCLMLVLVDRPTASDVVYSVYYDNPSATLPTYTDEVTVTGDSSWHIDAPNYKDISFQKTGGSFKNWSDKNGQAMYSSSNPNGFELMSNCAGSNHYFGINGVSGNTCTLKKGPLAVNIFCIAAANNANTVDWWFYPDYFEFNATHGTNGGENFRYFIVLTPANFNKYYWTNSSGDQNDIQGSGPWGYMNDITGYAVIDLQSNFIAVWDESLPGAKNVKLASSDGISRFYLEGFNGIGGTCALDSDYFSARFKLDYGDASNQLGKDEENRFDYPLNYEIGNEKLPDEDGDGVIDSEDICPTIFGVYCNGCPEPNCHGCAVSYCPTAEQPYCIVDDSQCSSTICPADGCGAGFCYKNQTGTYTPVDNTCELVDDTGTCTNNPCTLICKFDKVCEMQDEISTLKEQLKQTQEDVSILKTTILTIQGQISAFESIINNIKYYINLIICQLLPHGLVKGITCPVFE